ncbi:Fe-S cluster assembly protein SufD [Truepera radiovictrix]|uniref:FeS assembly protein SufD n=1 Tax=Truepera radiovictrix (strain DSM 17093 / CIP 108686 / LMG 22925 / RQ-24) TaxID=649638 RepID=D7CY41_TRURR|nr:Fe-S cluster assembly protein SufD [Truepera radiovictrix]ADI13401.1 FeS assembly protein SufD [Truepera radiovictrix DSM 17093]WMT58036.1 Fe-S cluster assembly protein SufD [Truepera radiovictrix]
MSLTDTLSPELVEGIIQQHEEPAWLASERRAAWRTFEALPWPTNRDEAWRYTQLERFSLAGLELVTAPRDRAVSERITMRITDSDAEGALVYKGGEAIYRDSKLKEAGVIFTDLRTALKEHEALVRAHLYSVVNATQSKYAALSAALWQNGTFLFVPKNTEVKLPLGAFHTADAGGLTAPRTLIVLEPNAHATFIDEYTSDEFGERLFASGSVEIILQDGAKLRYVSLQNWSRTVAHVSRIRAHLERNSRLESLTVSLGADAARAEVECVMAGPGSESEMLGLYFADKGQHFNQYTLQHHAADHAHSDLLFKGALRDASTAVYSGLIQVDEGAQKTDAYQTNRNLLLDAASEAVSIPQLEIGANDVRCSHGSTVSPVPEDQRFYLMSRGLRPEVAEHVLVTGFLHEVTSRVTLPKVAEYVERVVQAKLGVPGVDEKL